MMAQQVKSQSDASQASTQRNSVIQEQVFKASAGVPTAASRVLNADTEFAFAYERREAQAPHESAHRTEGIAEQGDAAVDNKSIDAISGHAAANARLRFKHQRRTAASL